MSAPTVSPPRRSEGVRRFAPTVALLLVAVLVAIALTASLIVARQFREQARTASQIYAITFAGLGDPDPAAATDALVELGVRVRELGIPAVVTDNAGRVLTSANLPFDASADPDRVVRYAAELDRGTPALEIR
jgi:hypothetical protein